MRIEGEPGQRLPTAYLWLTQDEATELRDALDQMLTEADASWHAHVFIHGLPERGDHCPGHRALNRPTRGV